MEFHQTVNVNVNNPDGIRSVGPSSSKPKRPGGLTAVCILTLVIGGLQVLTGLTSLASLVAGEKLQQLFTPKGGLNPELDKLQAEMNAAMLGASKKFRTVNFLVYGVHLVLASCLVAGGIGLLKGKSWGWDLLVSAMLTGILYEIVAFFPLAMTQWEAGKVTQDYMTKIFEASGGANAPPAMGQLMGSFGLIAMVLGIVMWGVLAILKIAFYFFSVRYLRRPEIKAMFP